MCRGAKIFFRQVVGASKESFRKAMHFGFLFFILEKAKEKNQIKNEKDSFKKTEKLCFLGGCEEKRFFAKLQFWKIWETLFVFRRLTKSTHFRWDYLFLENGPLFWPYNITKHYKTRRFSRHRRKSKMALWLQAILGRGLERGLTICDTQKLCSVENANFIVLSAKYKYAEIKECQLKEAETYQK